MTGRATRLESLDALRGIAALAVVFWHWQHFWFVGYRADASFSRPAQPLYSIFYPLYERGFMAVDLFFTLSGFVFFWLYADAIGRRTVTARRFFDLRFSRLYPLHFATLLVVAGGQAIYFAANAEYFVYGFNDAYHFVLHLLFVPAVGWEGGWSFNGPVWSVSVEALVYALFFVVCLAARGSVALLWLAVAAGAIGGFGGIEYEPWSRGIGSFFVGGGVYLAYAWIVRRAAARRVAIAVGVLALLLWAGVLVALHPAIRIEPSWAHALAYFPALVLFPCTVLAAALFETCVRNPVARLAFLGDASYGVYLWHFPLQLVWMLGAQRLGVAREAFLSPWMLAGFIACLLILALASHRGFEMPMQRRIRNAWAASAQAATTIRGLPVRTLALYVGLAVVLLQAVLVGIDWMLRLYLHAVLSSVTLFCLLWVLAWRLLPLVAGRRGAQAAADRAVL